MSTHNPALLILGLIAFVLCAWALVDRVRLGLLPSSARTRLGVAAIFVAVCVIVWWSTQAGRVQLP
jgi:hypothetical protein